jgi:hypothetical protein
MSERDQQPHESGSRAVQEGPTGATGATAAQGGAVAGEQWREQTTPGITPIRGGAAAQPGQEWGTGTPAYGTGAPGYGTGPQGYGSPGHGPSGPDWGSNDDATEPEYSSRPVAFRRPDALAALLLILAGVAAAVSLPLRWVRGNKATGWDIAHRGIDAARSGLGKIFDLGYWEPMVVIAAGAVLFLLGLLMLLPARRHRFFGVLALLVALAAAAGVLTAMGQDHWKPSTYDLGMWFAVAVAALGLLGALKAMFTGPKLGTHG